MSRIQAFLKKNWFSIVLVVGVVAYIAVAGSTRTCSACAAVVDFVSDGN